MADYESRDLAGAARLARDADAGPGDDRPTRAEADHEAWLDEHACTDRCPCQTGGGLLGGLDW